LPAINLGAQKLSSKRIDELMKKWVNELSRAFSEEEVQMAPKRKNT
jgi:hypothetical protein